MHTIFAYQQNNDPVVLSIYSMVYKYTDFLVAPYIILSFSFNIYEIIRYL